MSPEISDAIYSQSNKLGISSWTFFSLVFQYSSFLFVFQQTASSKFTLPLGTFSHGFTYSGHPVSCAVALETLKIYKYVPCMSATENYKYHSLGIFI